MNLPDRVRVHFMNSLSGFKSANLIGTKGIEGQENLSIISSVTHLGSKPPLISLIFRPHVVERHSYENIIATKFFTVNHVDRSFFREAHQTSARYPRDISEFKACSIKKEYLNGFYAPFVKQSQIKLGIEYVESYEIRKNNCIFLAGQVCCVYYNCEYFLEDGSLDLESAGVVSISGLDTYHSCKKIAKLPYAKPTKKN